MVLVHFEDLVHQQHRRTVRKDLHDLFFVQHIIIPLSVKSKAIADKTVFCRQIVVISYSITQSTWLYSTISPGCAIMRMTLPSHGALISFMIFIASMMQRVSPSFTC